MYDFAIIFVRFFLSLVLGTTIEYNYEKWTPNRENGTLMITVNVTATRTTHFPTDDGIILSVNPKLRHVS